MFSEIRSVLVLLAALLMLGGASSAAAASVSKVPSSPRAKAAKFDLRFVARQTTKWRYDEHDHDLCSGGVTRARGSGSQSMVVRIPRVRVTVSRVPEWIFGDTVTRMWPRGYRQDYLAPFRVTVKVDREASSNSAVVVPPDRQCADGSPDAREPEPDCGARTLRGRLSLLPPFARRGSGLGIKVRGPYMAGGFDDLVEQVYRQCEIRGPSALQEDGPTAVIGARKLFGSKPRLIAVDRHRTVSGSGANRSETTTTWRMILKRRGKAK